jgi:membrane-associated phospholipid phosphatase
MTERRERSGPCSLLPLFCLLAVCGLLPATASAQGDPEPGLRWAPHRRVGLPEYATTLAAPVLLRFAQYALPSPDSARLGSRPVLFDEDVRSALVLGSRGARDDANRFSDVAWLSSMAYPYVDALLIAWVYRGSPDVAWQMTVISTQAFAITALITELSIHHLTRDRPGQEQCAMDPDYAPTCSGDSSFHSFPSGHTAGGFVGAGLACAHHLNLPLYGGGAPDVAACGLALTWASANAVARLMSDRHWASDVIVGAGIGLGLGWLMPQLLYYGATSTDESSSLLVLPVAGPGMVGLGAAGTL